MILRVRFGGREQYMQFFWSLPTSLYKIGRSGMLITTPFDLGPLLPKFGAQGRKVGEDPSTRLRNFP